MIPSIPSLASTTSALESVVSRSSSHDSNPMPLVTITSAACIRSMSLNDGSQSCGSTPPGTSTDTSARSPPTALADSYMG